MLIRSALESPDSDASNGGSNLRIRPFGIDLVTFEVVELSLYCGDFYQWISRFWSYPATSKKLAPNSRINKLDPTFHATGSESSSAFRINIVRQTHKRMEQLLWTTNGDGAHGTVKRECYRFDFFFSFAGFFPDFFLPFFPVDFFARLVVFFLRFRGRTTNTRAYVSLFVKIKAQKHHKWRWCTWY